MAEQTFLRNGRWLTMTQIKELEKKKPNKKKTSDKEDKE